MAADRPNILFIVTDHHAYFAHHRPSQFEYLHPRFEAMAAQGVRFDRAYSVCPLCSPARASMMTGMYPSSHGLLRNTDYDPPFDLRPEQRLYTHWLAEAGYRNAYVGKWHCGKQRQAADFGLPGSR